MPETATAQDMIPSCAANGHVYQSLIVSVARRQERIVIPCDERDGSPPPARCQALLSPLSGLLSNACRLCLHCN